MELWKLIVSYYSDLVFYNLDVDPIALLSLVFAMGVAGIWAVIAAYVAKKKAGAIIDPILDRHATDEQTAISPKEGGFAAPHVLIRLEKGSMLRKTVRCTGAEEPEEVKKGSAPTKKDVLAGLAAMRYYIPEEKRETAMRRYSAKKTTLLTVLFSIAVMLVLTVATYFFLPVILRMLDNFLTMTGG
ncbi:MAG: hypothetical protein E7619_08530 [Ruminococcaceae bacterium]|nr:hypothetical protein [Oscillospiraceae bacterium]